MSATSDALDVAQLQIHVTAFVRAFGLLQPDWTPCGRPVAVSEAHAIAELEREGPLPQHHLAARLRLEKSTVSRLVSRLQGRGWVERARRDDDGRVLWLELTVAGRAAAADLAAARQAKFTQILDAIPARDQRVVVEGLQALIRALGSDRC